MLDKIVYRWLTGLPLDGRGERSDAGWFVTGSVSWHRSGRTSRWGYRPRAVRAAIRTGLAVALVALAVTYARSPGPTLTGLAVAGAVALAGLVAASIRTARTWSHRSRYVRPAARVLAGPLGIPRSRRSHEWLTVPRDYATSDGAVIRVELPPDVHYSPDLRKLVADVVRDKLGIAEVAATWATVGKAPYVTLRPFPHPPARVTYADVRQAIADAPATAPVIGLAASGRVVAVDLEADAPHALLSMASGAGKSVLVRTLAAQLIANGSQVIVLDAKRVSQSWLRSLPGVTYCRDAATAHQALLDLALEVDRRYDVIDAAPDDQVDAVDAVDVGPRIILIFEEMVAMMGKLSRWWQTNRDKSDPRTSPAISAFLEIVSMGRQGRVNVIAVAQMGTARVLGGPESRESFSNRILGRYSSQNWKMLCGDIWPMPRSSSHSGRVQVVNGGIAVETQVAFLTVDEARALAASGSVTVPASWSHQGKDPVTVTAPESPSEPRYSLSEAARQPWCTLSYAGLRQAKSRGRKAGEWPPPVLVDGVEKWTRGDLVAALANRPRSVDQVDQVDA